MTSHPVAVNPYDDLEDILFLFSRQKFAWLPVLQNDKLKGAIFESAVLQAIFSNFNNKINSSKLVDSESTAHSMEQLGES